MGASVENGAGHSPVDCYTGLRISYLLVGQISGFSAWGMGLKLSDLGARVNFEIDSRRNRLDKTVTRVTLHTQGSTVGYVYYVDNSVDGPAHAGINLPFAKPGALLTRWPCTRRDQPRLSGAGLERRRVALHTQQGSTRGSSSHRNGPEGGPAHAGINPRDRVGRCPIAWRPCTRRDQPSRFIEAVPAYEVALHTQESTSSSWTTSPSPRGGPAHTGINLQ